MNMNIFRYLVCIVSIVLYELLSLVEADGSFKCGFDVCKEFQFCVRAPLIGEDESPYCLGCDSKQDMCGTEKQQTGCELFCKEYLTQKNVACDCHDRNDHEFHIDRNELIAYLSICFIVSVALGASVCHAYHTARSWRLRLEGTLRRRRNRVKCGDSINQAASQSSSRSCVNDIGACSHEIPEETSVKMPESEESDDQTTDSNDTVDTALLQDTTCKPNNINPTRPTQSSEIAPG